MRSGFGKLLSQTVFMSICAKRYVDHPGTCLQAAAFIIHSVYHLLAGLPKEKGNYRAYLLDVRAEAVGFGQRGAGPTKSNYSSSVILGL